MLSTKSVDLPLPNAEIWYRSADDGTFFHATSFYDDGFTMLSEIYAANFLAPPPLRKMPLDVFGNLRVPMIERLDQAAADEEGWIPTPLDRTSSDGLQQPVPFASLVGIPFQGVPNRGNSTFNIQTNYAYLSCQQPQKVKSLPPHLDAIFQDRSKNGISGNFVVGEPKLPTLSINLTDAGWASGRWQNRSQSVGNRQIGFASVVKEEYRHNVKVGNKTTTVQDITWANTTCTSTQTYVEARVFCRDANCGVIAVRRSTLDHEPEHLSQLDGLGYKNQYFHQYFSQVTDTAAQRNKVRITVTQNYIADPNNFRVLDAMAKKPDVFNITSEEFSTRFTTTYNSFYTAFAALANLLGTNLNLSTVTTPPPDTPARISTELFPALAPVPWKYRPGVLAGGNSTGSPFFAHKSIAEVTESEVRYSVNRVWVGIFTVSVAILLCVSLVGWGLQWRRIAPDFLGTVAGGLRDSEYIKLDDGEEENGGSSVLDGIQAARRWSGKRVLIADVKPEEEVGRVALVGCEEAEREGWGKVKLGRFYE